MTNSLRAFLLCATPALIVGCNNDRHDAAESADHTTTATSALPNTQAPPNVDIFAASGEGSLEAIAQHIEGFVVLAIVVETMGPFAIVV